MCKWKTSSQKNYNAKVENGAQRKLALKKKVNNYTIICIIYSRII